MSVFDRLQGAFRLNDDYDDDFYDEEENEEFDEDLDEPKAKSRFSKKMNPDEDLDELDDFDLDEEEPVKPKKKKASKEKSGRGSKSQTSSHTDRNSKITPIKKAGTATMEVCVIRPNSMEECNEIVDTLRDNCTVVLNLEGLDVETAQRIIDFTSGASYALDGTLRMVSSLIFILTPYGVEITGDIQDILEEAAPNIRTEF